MALPISPRGDIGSRNDPTHSADPHFVHAGITPQSPT